MDRIIDAQVYDKNIETEGIQFQIDNYYEPTKLSMRRRIDTVMRVLDPKEGEKILDIGCGVGTFAFHSAKAGAISYGIDYSQKSIQTAKLLSKRFGVSEKTNFLVGDAKNLPFEANCFDKIVSADFIEHITDNEKNILLKDMIRILKPGGRIIIFTPNKIRESLGDIYWSIRHRLFGDKIPVNDLHYGLISRIKFENILKENKLRFKFKYVDTTRPYLTHIPILNRILSLDLLWTIEKASEDRWPNTN
jgi:ubiquinone/menaquinone biosynthesis C-methylase UbiE